jgi:hypothetical protein
MKMMMRRKRRRMLIREFSIQQPLTEESSLKSCINKIRSA